MDLNKSMQILGGCVTDVLGKSSDNNTVNMSCSLHLTTEGPSNDAGVSELSKVEISVVKTPFISDGAELMLYINIINIGCIVTSASGIVGNIVSMVVYWKQGLNDSITLGFFVLSVSDFILVCMPLFRVFLFFAETENPDWSFDFTSVHYVSTGYIRKHLYSTSCLITMLLSLERCCCIIFPFKIQTIFTRKKTAIFLCVMATIHVVGLVCIPIAVQLRWQDIPGNDNNNNNNNNNNSHSSSQILRVWFSKHAPLMETFYSLLLSNVVPVGTQVVVTICAFIMIRGLRKSSQFRAVAKSATKESPDKNEGSLSPRDARLVKTMIILVAIFSACNAPFLAVTFAWRAVPELSIRGVYRNTLTVLFTTVYVIGNLNASANVFIYYISSSKFREVFKQVFCRASK